MIARLRLLGAYAILALSVVIDRVDAWIGRPNVRRIMNLIMIAGFSVAGTLGLAMSVALCYMGHYAMGLMVFGTSSIPLTMALAAGAPR